MRIRLGLIEIANIKYIKCISHIVSLFIWFMGEQKLQLRQFGGMSPHKNISLWHLFDLLAAHSLHVIVWHIISTHRIAFMEAQYFRKLLESNSYWNKHSKFQKPNMRPKSFRTRIDTHQREISIEFECIDVHFHFEFQASTSDFLLFSVCYRSVQIDRNKHSDTSTANLSVRTTSNAWMERVFWNVECAQKQQSTREYTSERNVCLWVTSFSYNSVLMLFWFSFHRCTNTSARESIHLLYGCDGAKRSEWWREKKTTTNQIKQTNECTHWMIISEHGPHCYSGSCSAHLLVRSLTVQVEYWAISLEMFR